MTLAAAKSKGSARGQVEAQVALAIVAVANSEAEIAKQLLFAAVADPALCPHALFVMCALGLILRDGVLAAAALGFG